MKRILNIVRFNRWWNSKVPMHLALFFLFVNLERSFISVLADAFYLLVWLITAAAFGYFLNDCFDIEEDTKAGKSNAAADLPVTARFALLLGLLLSAILPWVLKGQFFLAELASLQILLFTFYSVPPVRLKSKLYLGVLADALYAFIIPALLTVSFAKGWIGISISEEWPLLLWTVCAGVRAIIYHHINDRKNDLFIAKGNVVNRFGLRMNTTVFNLLLLPEIIAFLQFYMANGGLVLKLTALIVYTLGSFILLNQYGVRFAFQRKLRTAQIQFFHFYERWLLFVVLILLSLHNVQYLLVLFGSLLLFRLVMYYYLYHYTKVSFSVLLHHVFLRLFYLVKHIVYHVILLGSFYLAKKVFLFIYYKIILRIYFISRYRIAIPAFNYFVFHILRPPASFLVNYTIYGYRRIILRLDDSSARALVTTIPYTEFLRPRKNQKDEGAVQTKEYPSEKQREEDRPKVDEIWSNSSLTEDNRVIHGLWIGSELSKLELLTLKSFISHGHEFHLWTYGPLNNHLPAGVILNDANEIIPESKVFRYKYANAYGHGKGSVSGFSDIFRYKLLYERGGWWTDMDITCLQPLNITSNYFFREHHDLHLVGNLMKCPAGSEVMKHCYEEAIVAIDENNRDWHKPIEILNRHVFALNLQQYIYGNLSNEDKWDEVKLYIKKEKNFPSNYLFVHWMNEEWRSRGFSKNEFRLRSSLGMQMLNHQLVTMPEKRLSVVMNDFHHLFWLPFYHLVRE